MIAVTLLGCAAVAAGATYVESRVDVQAPVLGFECPDADDDRRGDLLVVTGERGKRTLLLYRQTANYGFPSEPDWRWTLPPEVVAYGFADVRDDPGRELVLLSSGGLYSVSTARSSIRGNLRREVEAQVFPEVADPGELPRFDWILDLDGDAAPEVVLPVDGALLVHRRTGEGFLPVDSLPLIAGSSGRTRGNIRVRIGSTSVETDERGLPEMLFPGAPCTFPLVESDQMLSASRTYDAPSLVDFDGDGRLDAIRARNGVVHVRRGLAEARFAATEDEPLYVGSDGADVRLVDLDGDRKPEVIVLEEDGDGVDKEFVVKVLPRSGDGVAAEPSARLKFQASRATFDFIDVDGDARVDLVVSRLELPSGLASLADVWVDSSVLVYRGGEGGTFSRKPDARWDRRLRPEQLQRIIETFVVDLGGDYDGDGLKDLLTIRDDGLVQIRGLVRAGDGLSFAEEPMSVYLPAHPVRAAVPCWISRDRVSDLVLRHDEALTVFVPREEG